MCVVSHSFAIMLIHSKETWRHYSQLPPSQEGENIGSHHMNMKYSGYGTCYPINNEVWCGPLPLIWKAMKYRDSQRSRVFQSSSPSYWDAGHFLTKNRSSYCPWKPYRLMKSTYKKSKHFLVILIGNIDV